MYSFLTHTVTVKKLDRSSLAGPPIRFHTFFAEQIMQWKIQNSHTKTVKL